MGKNNYQGALQQLISSGFNAASTTNDVILYRFIFEFSAKENELVSQLNDVGSESPV